MTTEARRTPGRTPAGRRGRLLGKYLFGCALFSIGAYLFIHSGLGTDPLDTFALGVLRHLPLTVSVVQLAVAVLCVTVVSLWTRRRPLAAPLFTFFFCGSLIDVQLGLDWMRDVAWSAQLVLAAGTLLCAYGSAFIIMSGFGIRAIDLLAIAVVRKWRWPFWAAKNVIELTLLGTGYLLGGPAGIGTVVFLLGVGLLVQPLLRLNEALFRMANHGLPRSGEPEPLAHA